MAEGLFGDILEQILIRLDVKDIIRCKRVCKSWYSLISSSGFVNSHLKHNNTTRRRRIVTCKFRNNLFGSYNGLVCILTSDTKLCVFNPCTRELKTLKDIYFHRKPYVYGFGYDSSSDDYKIILGKQKYMENFTRFYLLSLKSNSWKVVGDIKFYCGNGRSGILCNGAIHWLMYDQNRNARILSFDLSKEEFKEIPTPADERFEYTYRSHLGIIEDCLCIFDDKERDNPKWVMKNYNDKHSWVLMPHLFQWDDDVTHCLEANYNGIQNFFHRNLCLTKTVEYIRAPIFVQSLVSPVNNEFSVSSCEQRA